LQRTLLRLFLLVAILPFSALAQKDSAWLRVEAADPAGAAIAGARIELRNTASGLSWLCQTNAAGACIFAQLPPGNYMVLAAASGFAAQARPIALLIDQPATLDFRFAVQSVVSTVEVLADVAVLNRVDASMGSAVSQQTIQALPLEGRNVPDLLASEPGVLYLGTALDPAYDSRSGATLGARSDQGNMQLDGVDNNDRIFGYAFTGALRTTLDSVDEFRVTTAGYGADSGGTSGAQIYLTTRRGSNRLHGSLYEYNRSGMGEANDWFNKQAQLASGMPNRAGKLIRNTFGISAGGPICSNRAFFFANYEGQRTAENQQQTLIVPTQSMRAGELQYPSSSNITVLLSPAQIAAMDPNCGANGNCPWGPGPDPFVLGVFAQYPQANGAVAGDGLNTASYTWSAPDPAALNLGVVRLDLLAAHQHQLFARGTLQSDDASGAPQFPGMPASSNNAADGKGVALGDLWSPSAGLTNHLRYGFTRQTSASHGIGQGQYANFYNIATPEAETRTALLAAPVQNLADDLSWSKGAHWLQAGIEYRRIALHSQSDQLSYNYGYTNAYALEDAGIAGSGQSLDPGAYGYPAVSSSFANAYSFAAANLTGLLDLVTDQANYSIDPGGATATLLVEGAMLDRTFRNNEFEVYGQDTWRVSAALTVTAGVRYSLSQTPYETHGQQVQPTVDMHQWFATRAAQAKVGNSVQPDLWFAPSGQARGLKPYWPMQKLNFAPRLSITFSPTAKGTLWRALLGGERRSVLRAGAGIYYDHFGSGIVRLFDQAGSFGLSESTTNPTNVLTPDTSPRFTGIHNLPQITTAAASSIQYPSLAPNNPLSNGFAIAHGLDDHMKMPYAESVEVSLERELPGGFVLELAYAGRFGRRLLQQLDLAQPLDLVDPASGQDYFTAATALSRQKVAGAQQIAPVPFFEDLFPDAAGGGQSATQAIYNSVWFPGNETGSLYMLDILCTPGCGGQTNRFWTRQFASLYAWSAMGASSYNALQLTLERRMHRGLEAKLGYTLSKSIDLGSDAERTQFSSSTGTSAGSSFSAIVNSWNPRLNRAPSDFDVRHLLTGNWVAELPVGRGRLLLNRLDRRADRALGGWSVAGLFRWTSGLPFSVVSGAGWGTDWDEKSNMIQTGPIRTHTHLVNGAPEAFANPVTALANMRNPYPGEAGQRNNFRGDGDLSADASLTRSWRVHKAGTVKFGWEVFNVTNSVRFDVNPNISLQNMTSSGEFGVYGATLTKPRVQQFSLRYAY
jgi:hypothetical protein